MMEAEDIETNDLWARRIPYVISATITPEHSLLGSHSLHPQEHITIYGIHYKFKGSRQI